MFWIIFFSVIGVIALWFLASIIYKPIGKVFRKIIDDSINTLKEDDTKKSNVKSHNNNDKTKNN